MAMRAAVLALIALATFTAAAQAQRVERAAPGLFREVTRYPASDGYSYVLNPLAPMRSRYVPRYWASRGYSYVLNPLASMNTIYIPPDYVFRRVRVRQGSNTAQ